MNVIIFFSQSVQYGGLQTEHNVSTETRLILRFMDATSLTFSEEAFRPHKKGSTKSPQG